ncbi:hypothetical protein PILCRDRAFT_5388 [Piloderma croceum F 1598]|uniref:Uncharacterized protein n=1 Tax=Piloderma croceum (strain F 1598) TaxID=765440 RepID=A0A0C3BHF1_PILCF|nr:hypothetical protein PILCRDRAFT_5388 [Piloderma croceum F 1598]
MFAFASFVVSSPPPAPTAPNGGPAFDPAGQKNVGNKNGTQFIGGQCLSDADCASKCCAGPSPTASFMTFTGFCIITWPLARASDAFAAVIPTVMQQ